GMDHVRVHPRFLHSNATSHKWVLGAFAELLDNSLDEVCNGATFVNIDMIKNKKDGNKMLLIEDNGGGMDPDKMRQCMSLGYSLKSKVADTIGQYGNGFKTSTMRLGADVIVFSRCSGRDGNSFAFNFIDDSLSRRHLDLRWHIDALNTVNNPLTNDCPLLVYLASLDFAELDIPRIFSGPTQSIGLLSYTFLRSTGKEDIVVPMLDYERSAEDWKKITRSSAGDWNRNVETIVQWSPFSSEADLLRQVHACYLKLVIGFPYGALNGFNRMKDHGTLVVIYNLWEDDQGLLELDFDTDQHDIQIRGVNRDDKNIQMAQQYPNSRHYLTYRHSLRSYASILYLRIPPGFRVILRGKDVEHHNIVNDMMMTQQVTYRPNSAAEGMSKDVNMVAVVTMGFVKDAKSHIDVQGFNVYHKNRLIKPFWRLWNPAGSGGRGVIGVLEANFVEPAHDKQGFERTIVLSRLEARLIQMQKTYWGMHCHKIGYAVARGKKDLDEGGIDFHPILVFDLLFPELHPQACGSAFCLLIVWNYTSPDYLPHTPSRPKKKSAISGGKVPTGADKYLSHKNQKLGRESDGHPNSVDGTHGNGHIYSKGERRKKASSNSEKGLSYSEPSSPSAENLCGNDLPTRRPERQANGHSRKVLSAKNSYRKDTSHANELEIKEAVEDSSSGGTAARITTTFQSKVIFLEMVSLKISPPFRWWFSCFGLVEKRELRVKGKTIYSDYRLKRKEEDILGDLLHDLQSERERCKSLEAQLQVAAEKIEGLNKEQETLIDIFSEERARRDVEEENLRKKLKAEKELRDVEEENLRKKLKDATNTIQGLVEKVRLLEKMKSPACKPDR
ncbi:hypothetical protein RJ639_004383, partial [Escallonia herrerae]